MSLLGDELAEAERERDWAKGALRHAQNMVRSRNATIASLQRAVLDRAKLEAAACADREALLAEIKRKDESYATLAREAEEHRAAWKIATKSADRERARADNLERALEVAQVRIRSLEESARRLLASHDEASVP